MNRYAYDAAASPLCRAFLATASLVAGTGRLSFLILDIRRMVEYNAFSKLIGVASSGLYDDGGFMTMLEEAYGEWPKPGD